MTGNIRFLAKNGQLHSVNTTEEKAQEKGLTKRFHADEVVRKQENNRRMQRQSRCDLNKDANPKNARKRLKNDENKTKRKNKKK